MSNVEVVQGIYEAFGRGDVPAILDRLAEDVAWDQDLPSYGVGYLEPGTGRDHVAKFFTLAADSLEFEGFQPLNFLSGGDQVIALVDVHVRNKATGQLVHDLEAHVWTFGADGLVSRFAHLVDRHAHMSAWRGQEP